MAEFVTSFEETFDGGLDKWVVLSEKNGSANGYPGGPGQFGTGEWDTKTDRAANLKVVDGELHITPTLEGGKWYSARIETARVFKPARGSIMRVDTRLAYPDVHGAEAQGYWPAFWMMGETQRDNRWQWPACGEFDIVESVCGVPRVWAVVHGGPASSWGGPFNEPSGNSNGGVPLPRGGDLWGEFHDYRFEWDRTTAVDELRFYVDNVQTHSVKPGVVSAGDWANMSGHPGYFLIINCAMGGAFPDAFGGGPTGATRAGRPLRVQHVRISYAGSEAAEVADGNDGRGGGAPVNPTPTDPPAGPTPTDPTPTDPGTPPAPVEGAPSNLRAVSGSASSVTIGWDGPTADYEVLRSGVRIATVTGTTFTDVGLGQNVPYLYSVRRGSSTTPVVSVTLPLVAAPAPDPDPTPDPEPTPVPVGDRVYRLELTIPADGSDPVITVTR